MSDPTLLGHPGKLSDAVQFVCNQNFDDGGVHINSGVPNHAFALVVDGGNYNGVNVAGIGLVKAAKVQYRALTTYLTSGANFVDDVNALNQSCTDLIGTSGITTTDCNQVALALQAVEMSATWPCTGATVPPPLCSADMTASTIFSDGFEAGGGNWTVSSTGIGAWTLSKGWASDGLWSARGSDPASVSDHNLTQAAAVILPANARLQFDHAFGFETSTSFWDGAVLEYSTNGGGTWVDAGSAELITAGQAYGGTITAGELPPNPLGGRAGFVGPSYGYTATQLDLSSLTGMSVKFRFRIGTDSSNGLSADTRGWAVDDFSIYACVSNPTLTVIGTGTVTSSGVSCTSTAGVTSGDCVESASPGTVFALSGVASAGSTFAGFTGDADCTDASVTLTANTTCTADFTLNPPPTLGMSH